MATEKKTKENIRNNVFPTFPLWYEEILTEDKPLVPSFVFIFYKKRGVDMTQLGRPNILAVDKHMEPRGFQFIEQNGINFNISYSYGLMLGYSGQKWKLEPLYLFSLWLVQRWNNYPEEMFLSPVTNSHRGQVNQDLQRSWKWGEQEERTKYY